MAQDLIRLDSVSSENKILKQNYSLLSEISALKDAIVKDRGTIIDNYKIKEDDYKNIILLKDKQLTNSMILVNKLNSDLKKTKRKHTFIEIIGGILLSFVSYKYITK